MKTVIKRTRLFAFAIAFALAVQPFASVMTASQAKAEYYQPISPVITHVVTGGGGGSSTGGWIVGGLFISVASIITCAMLVGADEGRELTLEEAVLAGLIPLSCLLRDHFNDQ